MLSDVFIKNPKKILKNNEKILEKNEKINYIVLTPSHKSLEPYRKLNINCDVVQTYEFSGKIPSEDYIIVDEIGMFTTKGHNVLFKLFLSNKSYEFYQRFG